MQSIVSAGLPVIATPKGVTQLTYIYICFYKNKCMFCYPLFGLLSGVNDTLTIVCIGYSVLGNTKKVRCDIGVGLDTFYINKCNFCYPFLPL